MTSIVTLWRTKQQRYRLLGAVCPERQMARLGLLPHQPGADHSVALRAGAYADTLQWLLATQHANGAWGQYMPTLEETALVLLALLHYHRTCQSVTQAPLQRAAHYLLENEHPFAQHYPELWIGKALYAPTPVIRSCILAALGLYADTFPNSL